MTERACTHIAVRRVNGRDECVSCEAAADLIRQLRAEAEKQRVQHETFRAEIMKEVSDLTALVAKLRTENERLRAALEAVCHTVRNLWASKHRDDGSPAEELEAMIQARVALGRSAAEEPKP